MSSKSMVIWEWIEGGREARVRGEGVVSGGRGGAGAGLAELFLGLLATVGLLNCFGLTNTCGR